jgi:hypothetical protein
MLGIDVSAPPLPQQETRLEFMKRYAADTQRGSPRCKRRRNTGGRNRQTFSMSLAPRPGS